MGNRPASAHVSLIVRSTRIGPIAMTSRTLRADEADEGVHADDILPAGVLATDPDFVRSGWLLKTSDRTFLRRLQKRFIVIARTWALVGAASARRVEGTGKDVGGECGAVRPTTRHGSHGRVGLRWVT